MFSLLQDWWNERTEKVGNWSVGEDWVLVWGTVLCFWEARAKCQAIRWFCYAVVRTCRMEARPATPHIPVTSECMSQYLGLHRPHSAKGWLKSGRKSAWTKRFDNNVTSSCMLQVRLWKRKLTWLILDEWLAFMQSEAADPLSSYCQIRA